MRRELAWDGCVNVRDLGGLALEDGGSTAFRVLVRADNVRGLSDDGWRALSAYGVRRVVDLRWTEELAEDPARELEVEVEHVPLLGRVRGDDFGAKYDAYLDRCEKPADFYRWSYLEYLDEFRPAFGRAVSALAESEGTALFHCAGGKDRTGLIAALVLLDAGAEPAAIAADWAVSEESWAADAAVWIDEAPDELEAGRRRIFAVAPPEAMVDVLAELDRRGGARAYLEEAGARPSMLDRLRARLRGEA